MATSYFELLSSQEIQQAMADSLQTQVAQHRAVAPSVNLAGPIKAATEREKMAHDLLLTQGRLALGARENVQAGERLALKRNAFAYEQKQLPWATGIGAIGAATNIYTGYRALQKADEREAQAQQQQGIMAESLARNTVDSMRLRQMYEQAQQGVGAGGMLPAQEPTLDF